MKINHKSSLLTGIIGLLQAVSILWTANTVRSQDLEQIKASGVLRHLGVTYANFVTGAGDGFDVEIVKLFAASLGLNYEYVKTDWTTLVPDLTGEQIKVEDGNVKRIGKAAIRGDIDVFGSQAV
jgi:ABC-type amino acid transport substrate-binding protein